MQHRHITPDRLFSLGTSYRCAKVLLCAIELDVFTALDGRPRMATDLARMLGIHNRSACDFFDALVALGLLQRDTDGRYANTMEASLYLDQNKSTYLGGMFNQFNAREYQMWSKLGDALRTGEPQIGSASAEHFATIYDDPERFRTFVNAMTAGSLLAAKPSRRSFPGGTTGR